MPAASSGYRRSTGSARGEARRQQLLERVTDDLAANGLVDFSLRRAARAAGTTHKVLLYHFDSADDLLTQAIHRLRERRISNALAAATRADRPTLASRVRAVWPALVGEESIVPPDWSDRRKFEVAQLILATLRGFLIDWLTSGDMAGAEAGLAALVRALEREEGVPG